MANITVYKKTYLTYLRHSHRFRDFNIWNIWPWKSRLTSQSTSLGMAPFTGKYQTKKVIWCIFSKPFKRYLHAFEIFDLDKVGQYHNIWNSHLRWQISTWIKFIPEHVWLAFTVFEIFTLQISWLWKWRSRSWWTVFAVASFDCKYLTSYLMAIVMFAFFELHFSK